MNTYQLTYILDGKLTPAKRKSADSKMEEQIRTFSGKITNTQDHGKKDLAYPIKNIETGFFTTLSLEMDGSNLKRLNDKLRVDEGILRYLIIKHKVTKK